MNFKAAVAYKKMHSFLRDFNIVNSLTVMITAISVLQLQSQTEDLIAFMNCCCLDICFTLNIRYTVQVSDLILNVHISSIMV